MRDAGISKKGSRGYRLAIARRRRSAAALDRRHVLALRFPLPHQARAAAPRSRAAGSPPPVVLCLPEFGEARYLSVVRTLSAQASALVYFCSVSVEYSV